MTQFAHEGEVRDEGDPKRVRVEGIDCSRNCPHTCRVNDWERFETFFCGLKAALSVQFTDGLNATLSVQN